MMKRKQRRSQAPGFCLERATIPSSLQARQAALWAIRMAQGKVRNDFLTQNPERFIGITAPHLKWCESSFKRFFFYYDGSDEEREALEPLSPQEAWEQLSSECDYNTQQAFKAFRKFEAAALNRVLSASQKALEESLNNEPDMVQDNVLMLQHLLGFSMVDAVLLHLAAVASQSNAVRGMLLGTTIENESDGVSMLAYLLSVDESAVREALKQSGTLNNLNFLKPPEVAGDLYEMLTLQAWCHACFAEPHESITQLVRHFLEPATSCDLSSDDFPHLADDFTALTQYLQGAMKERTRGVNLLIYGAPGTGKTVFAKALAQALKARLYEVANHFDNGEPIHKGERLAFLKMSEKFLARRKDSLILFDEIEDVFPERFDPTRPSIARRYAATGKAWMNQTLENNQVPVIWISNNIEQMDPAYLRRFSYHLEIRTPPLRIRQAIAQRYLGNTGMRRDFINQLASDTALTPALMENAARVVQLAGRQDAAGAEQLAQRVIRQCQMALGQSSESRLRTVCAG